MKNELNLRSKLKILLRLGTFQTIPFLRPYWKAEEWRISLCALAGSKFPTAVNEIERRICRLTRAKYALATNLGRVAMQIALEAYRFAPRSEVLLPSFACTGVLMPVIQAGLVPIFVDIDEEFNISLENIHEAVTPNTRAIILPHLSGKWARDTLEILQFARAHSIKVIEDAAQSFGLEYQNKWAGTFGDVGIFSFNGGKNLSLPDGGILFTSDQEVIKHCQSLCLPRENEGVVRRRLLKFMYKYVLAPLTFAPVYVIEWLFYRIYQHYLGEPVGSVSDFIYPKYCMSDITASLALKQIEKYEEIIQKRKTNAKTLLSSGLLKELGAKYPKPKFHIFTKFLISFVGESGAQKAGSLKRMLRENGVQWEYSYTPLHLRPPFAHFRHAQMSMTEKLWRGAFSIPVNPWLNEKHLNRINNVLRKAQKELGKGT